jgi:hypothetical protein
MGTGTFLLEAARYLASATDAPQPKLSSVAEHCLYGVDRDPLAVELAIHSLWLETGARPAVLAHHLRQGDPLQEESCWPPPDAVVGNPPWGVRFTPSEREHLARRFPGATRQTFDSFKLFLDLASTRSRGTVGMVVPQAVLTQATHADIREVVLRRMDPYFAAYLGNDAFPGVAAPACALVFGPKPGPALVRCVATPQGPRPRAKRSVPSALWDPVRGFPLERSGLLGLLRRLQDRHPTLRDMEGLYRVRDTGINYNRASVATRILYSGPEPEDPRDVPRYRGRDFGRYTAVRPGGWLRHDAASLLDPGEALSLDWATYRLPEKIVFRQTADRIVATLDRGRMAMGRSVIALTARGNVSLSALLACLNSGLLTALYRALSGEEGRLLPQVKVGTVLALPVPGICSSPLSGGLLGEAQAYLSCREPDHTLALLARTGEDPAFGWACLGGLAVKMLDRQGRDSGVDALIDQIVCRLYGLSTQDIAVVQEG